MKSRRIVNCGPASVMLVTGVLTFLAAGCFMQAQVAGDSRQQQGPSLEETIAFMDTSVRPEQSSIDSANSCEISVVRNRTYMFALPQSTIPKGKDQFGVPHYAIDWIVVEEPEVTRFNFAAIDPSSINSKPVPSVAFLKEHNVDENPTELKNVDLTVVFFNSANSTSSIETGHFPALKEGETARLMLPVFDHHNGMGLIVFESKDRAERFVTAFIHAVKLCGGKDSDFPPTPSKP